VISQREAGAAAVRKVHPQRLGPDGLAAQGGLIGAAELGLGVREHLKDRLANDLAALDAHLGQPARAVAQLAQLGVGHGDGHGRRVDQGLDIAERRRLDLDAADRGVLAGDGPRQGVEPGGLDRVMGPRIGAQDA
jgi:hypothetical protein